MARVRYEPNPAMLDELGNDQQFRRFLLARGIDVKRGIKTQLPVGKTGGRRVKSFAGLSYADMDGAGRDVAVAVGTRWRLGHLIEFGGPRNPAYAPVRKAAVAAGLRFEEGAR